MIPDEAAEAAAASWCERHMTVAIIKPCENCLERARAAIAAAMPAIQAQALRDAADDLPNSVDYQSRVISPMTWLRDRADRIVRGTP